MIKINDVTKRYEKKTAVSNVSLQIDKGQIHGLIGENSAGKTTLIKCIVGIYTPDEGSITLDGNDVYDNVDAKKRIAYVGDYAQFVPFYTVSAVLKMYARFYDTFSIDKFNKYNEIYKIPLEEVTQDQRRKAKTANFGIIYGITTFGLAERMEVSRGEARELIDNYFQTYPKVKEYMDKSIEQGREKGYAETIFGRRCPLSKINSLNASERGNAERVAINAPIQGTAADIIKIAMIRVDRRMREEGLRSKLILQVHDELNFSVVPEEKEILERIVREEMESAYQMQVPLIVDCGWGDNWLEAH